MKLEPALSKNELESSVKISSKKLHKSEKAVYKQIYNELKADIAQGNLEDKDESSKLHTLGASSGTKKLKNSATGDFYYTPSKTAGVNHGHVGLYYSKDSIVESVPKKGVYKIKVTNRRVENGAVIKSVKVSSSKKKSATN
ncbi:hypothetical protein [Rummeliibacillus pycnus]|uniref:hypothetical protein n=1 Tax=Rummeliibacillus pycnus TaxID=101070 RepID=UPI0037CC3C32